MAFRAINRKILSSLHRSSYWWDFNETSHEWPYIVLGDMFLWQKPSSLYSWNRIVAMSMTTLIYDNCNRYSIYYRCPSIWRKCFYQMIVLYLSN
jgi:hypothetical protein